MLLQHLLPLQHLLKLHLPQRLPPTLLQLLRLLVLWKPLLVLLPTLLLLAPPMLPKPLSTPLLKLPKPLPSLHSNRFIRVWYPSTKKPPSGGFFVVYLQQVDPPAASRITSGRWPAIEGCFAN